MDGVSLVCWEQRAQRLEGCLFREGGRDGARRVVEGGAVHLKYHFQFTCGKMR